MGRGTKAGPGHKSRFPFIRQRTTELTKEGFEHLAHALGVPVTAILRWDEVLLRVETRCGASTVLIPVSPLGIHMGKVAVATGVIHEFVAGMLTPTQVEAAIAAVACAAEQNRKPA
jgi:hypothetical protein